jgi:leucyl-tRNA synthetase
MRFTIQLPLDLTKDQIEEIIMKDERTIKQLEGRTPNKVIIVPGRSLIWLNFLKFIVKNQIPIAGV